jgi:hypothetical protein
VVVAVTGSPYGAGAPTYDSADLQRATITGRLEVATGIRDRARKGGNRVVVERWEVIVDELLDRLREVQG